MSMTENKIKEATLEDAIYCAKGFVGLEVCEECRFYGLCHTWCDDVYRIIVDALEEIQAYRAIDTVEDIREIYSLCKILQNVVKDYSAIGTIEELQALKEKSVAKKIVKPQNENGYKCPICYHWVGYRYAYCDGCGQALDFWKEE